MHNDRILARVGKRVCDEPLTSEEAIKQAGLDWEVKVRPLYVQDNDSLIDTFNIVQRHKAIVREDNQQVLGVVGKNYRPVQNADAFKFMDELVQDGSMRYHTVGNLRGGKRVWLLGKTGSFEPVQGDEVGKYIFLWNSHDGSTSLKCMTTTIRVVCENAVASAMRHSENNVSVRHTTTLNDRIIEAKEIMAAANKQFQQFEEFSKFAAGKQFNTQLFEKFALDLFPEPPKDVNMPSREKARNEITRLFEEGTGNDMKNVAGTAWAAFNAVTEYVNYYKPVRGQEQDQKRFEYTLLGGGADLTNKAHNAIMRLAA